MSGVTHRQDEDEELDPAEEEVTDRITEWFLTSGPTDALELHHWECPVEQDRKGRCDCVTVTLVRGATA